MRLAIVIVLLLSFSCGAPAAETASAQSAPRPFLGAATLVTATACGDDRTIQEPLLLVGDAVYHPGFPAGVPRPADGPMMVEGTAQGNALAVRAMTSAPAAAVAPLPSAPRLGARTVLVVRVDTAGNPGDPASVTGERLTYEAAQQLMEEVGQFFQEASYGRFVLRPAVVTPVLRVAGLDAAKALAAARAMGFDEASYDFVLVAFGRTGAIWWNGYNLGRVSLFNGLFTSGLVAHEMGHALGLGHSPAFCPLAPGVGTTGPGGGYEYGNTVSVMGMARFGPARLGHYHVEDKRRLGWCDPSGVQSADASGLYRIAALERPASPGECHALAVGPYRLEFRAGIPSNPWVSHGASLYLGANLLDTTSLSLPGTLASYGGFSAVPRDLSDHPLTLGRTFSDPSRGIHITPVRGIGSPPEALEVLVHRGAFPGNADPVLRLSGDRTVVAPGTPVGFSADPGDANGDTVTLAWDFGDGEFHPEAVGAERVQHAWSAPGEYVVRCVATDARGGTASRNLLVTVGSRAPGTFHLGGQVTLQGRPVEGATVALWKYVVGWPGTRRLTSLSARTDSEGRYLLVGVPPQPPQPEWAYAAFATAPGLASDPDFTRPLRVTADLDGIDLSVRDTAAPVIRVTSPEPADTVLRDRVAVQRFFTRQGYLQLQGEALDNDAVSEGLCRNETTGASVSLFGAEAWWTVLPLAEGANEVLLTARDRSGNLGSLRLVVVSDTLAPQLSVRSPLPGRVKVPAGPVMISGTASDNVLLAGVTWRNAATGESGTASRIGTKWFATVVLRPGDNQVVVTATDAVGNTSSTRITLVPLAPADREP